MISKLSILLILGILWVSGSASAADPEDLERLRISNECKGCDLKEANLAGANLREANLKEADLTSANL
ncbi:MAG: pentapeptide repeat-containing protein, partial [Geitlerinemataceae cyanobacterium]